MNFNVCHISLTSNVLVNAISKWMRWKDSFCFCFYKLFSWLHVHAQFIEKENNWNIYAIFLFLLLSWIHIFVLHLPIAADTQLAVLQLWFGFGITLYFKITKWRIMILTISFIRIYIVVVYLCIQYFKKMFFLWYA